jgi:tetratricopeptide (TPR) repeat protein
VNGSEVYRDPVETQEPAAHNAFQKGWAHLLRRTPEDAVEAIAFFRKAIELDPDYSRAYAALAQIYWDNSRDAEFNKLTGEIQMASSVYANDTTAWELLQKAGDKPLSQAQALSARMLQRQRRYDEAMRKARQAVALGPSDPTAYDALIESLIYSGEFEEAIRLADESIGFAPDPPGEKLYLKAMAYYVNGSLTEALSTIERARTHNPKQIRYAAIHAAALAELGRAKDAKAAFEEYRLGLINFDRLNWTTFYWPFEDVKYAERLSKGLIKAGLVDSTHHYYAVSPENRLRSDEINALVANKIMIGADYGPAGSWEEFQVRRDEHAQIIDQDILTYFREGKTRVENNLLCDPWYAFGDFCVAIYRNADGSPEQRNEYVFFTFDGIFTFSVFDSAGW